MPHPSRATRGFTLVEVLIAIVLLSVGLLALGAWQLGLAGHGESMRQRGEALRLAQDRLELWRLQASTEPAPATNGWDESALRSNTRYERAWTATSAPDDTTQDATIDVRWTDRAGPQSLVLRSAVTPADPAEAGWLLAGTGPFEAARPLHRSPHLPLGALPVGNTGRSKLRWPGERPAWLLFDDASGALIAECAVEPNPDNTTRRTLDDACVQETGLMLQGYIDGDVPTVLPHLRFTAPKAWAREPDCILQPAPDARHAGGALDSHLHYSCRMHPIDHDGDARTPRHWSARVSLGGVGELRVCRYTADPSRTDPAAHPEVYREVTIALSQQNFHLAREGCPAGTAVQASG